MRARENKETNRQPLIDLPLVRERDVPELCVFADACRRSSPARRSVIWLSSWVALLDIIPCLILSVKRDCLSPRRVYTDNICYCCLFPYCCCACVFLSASHRLSSAHMTTIDEVGLPSSLVPSRQRKETFACRRRCTSLRFFLLFDCNAYIKVSLLITYFSPSFARVCRSVA